MTLRGLATRPGSVRPVYVNNNVVAYAQLLYLRIFYAFLVGVYEARYFGAEQG